MNKRTTTSVSVAAVLAASALALQMPIANAQSDAAGNGSTTAQASDQNGVPGVELNAGSNASDRGLPGVEMNVGRDGDQQNIDPDTRTLGAGPDMSMDAENSDSSRPMRADRN